MWPGFRTSPYFSAGSESLYELYGTYISRLPTSFQS